MSTAGSNPDLIYSLVSDSFKPQVVRLALLLDVFSILASGQVDTASVAETCQCNPTGMKNLLDYLVSIKLLKVTGRKYSLSPSANQFLVRDSKSYAGDMLLEYTDPGTWDSLLQTLRSGKFVMLESERSFVQDAWLESCLSANRKSALALWDAAKINPKNQSNYRVLDLASGCAIKSFVLAEKYKNVWVTCLDKPAVIEVARDLAERMKLSVRVNYLTTDLLTTDFGQERFEACLLGQITHYLTKEQNHDLFSRIRKTLTPNTTLVIDVPMRSAKLSENTAIVNLLLWASSGGGTYSYKEYERWLVKAGFSQVRKISDRALVAHKL